MNSKKRFITATLFSLVLYNCARQTTPEGGLKDIIKPELIKSSPENNQKNFKQKKVELYFTENVKLKDPKEEILITPSPGKEIKFEALGNKITIDPKQGWKDSTTYNIQFRESIQDITESNPTENLQLAFSTGSTIDSLTIAGSIKEARKETIPEKITIAIYTQDTFKIFNHIPSYFTKSDKQGKFKINNLKEGTYFIYAFDDRNKNLKVESTNEKYGFISKPLKLTKNIDSVNIALVNIDSRPIKLNSKRSTNKTSLLRFNKNISTYKATFKNKELLTTYGDNQTEIVFYYFPSEQSNDSLRVRLEATDSLNQKFDSLLYIKQGDSKAIKTSFSISTEPPTFDYGTGNLELIGKTNIPISKINMDSIYIKVDTTTKLLLSKIKFELDTATRKFSLKATIDTLILNHSKKIEPKKNKQPPTKINALIALGKGFLISIYNDSSKQQLINLPPKELNNTGSLSVKIRTKSKNFYVELINSSNQIVQQFTNKTEYTFTKLKGEEYKLRAYIDTNSNGKWDTSNITTRAEAEPVFYYKTLEKKYSFPIRESWEVGPFIFTF